MKRPILAAMAAVMLVASCGAIRDSRFNPFNWFGRSEAQERTLAPEGGYETGRERRPLVDQVVAMRIDPTPGGAILTAIGLAPRQGYWEAELVPVAEAGSNRPVAVNGALVFDFRIVPPIGQTRVSTPQSREVSVALFLSDQTLAGVNRITVRGQRTQRTSRR